MYFCNIFLSFRFISISIFNFILFKWSFVAVCTFIQWWHSWYAIFQICCLVSTDENSYISLIPLDNLPLSLIFASTFLASIEFWVYFHSKPNSFQLFNTSFSLENSWVCDVYRPFDGLDASVQPKSTTRAPLEKLKFWPKI